MYRAKARGRNRVARHDATMRTAVRADFLDLRRFPVDLLKLDRSFVGMITGSDRVPALIGGLLELARTLDVHTLAKGIETPEQRIALTDEGCEQGQGFLFSAPIDHDAAARLLATRAVPRVGEPLTASP